MSSPELLTAARTVGAARLPLCVARSGTRAICGASGKVIKVWPRTRSVRACAGVHAAVRQRGSAVSRARFVLPPPWHEEREQGASLSERVERRVRKFVEGVERENLGNFPDLLGFVANLHAALPSLMRSTALYLVAHRSQ